KRGLVLIDPAYENPDELTELPKILAATIKHWDTGTYAIWYPIKLRPPVDRFLHALKEKISRPMWVGEINLFALALPSHLNGCGLVIINPPYKVVEQITPVVRWLEQKCKLA